jgi:hypothetical protein
MVGKKLRTPCLMADLGRVGDAGIGAWQPVGLSSVEDEVRQAASVTAM